MTGVVASKSVTEASKGALTPIGNRRLEKVREQVQAAHALGLTAVISSSIESSLGLTQLARIAAWLTPETIPGLDTLDLMQAQQVRRWPGSPLPLVEVDALERLL